jgi:hypothetical protein
MMVFDFTKVYLCLEFTQFENYSATAVDVAMNIGNGFQALPMLNLSKLDSHAEV